MSQKLTLTVMLGGPSAEREVSLRSGAAVAKALRSLGHTVHELDPKTPDWTLPAGTQAVFLALHGTYGDRSYIDAPLITPLGISPDRVSFFDSLAEDLEAECQRVNEFIASRGGLDIIMVGIGMNGHLGLNEPGTSFDTYAHISDLEEVTASVGQKYFQSETPLTQGITVGLKHFLEAKVAIVLANGAKKKGIIQRVLEESVNESLPASALKIHSNGYLWVDAAADPA